MKLQISRTATSLKETPTQVFSCKYCEIFKNTYFEEHLWTTIYVYLLSHTYVAQELLYDIRTYLCYKTCKLLNIFHHYVRIGNGREGSTSWGVPNLMWKVLINASLLIRWCTCYEWKKTWLFTKRIPVLAYSIHCVF